MGTVIHGLSSHPLYKIHSSIKVRRLLCDHWLSITNFYEDLLPSYKEDHSLCRIDCDKVYSLNNVFWKARLVKRKSTLSEQELLFINNSVDIITTLNNNNMINDDNVEAASYLLSKVITILKGE